jgi:hypothetical protein
MEYDTNLDYLTATVCCQTEWTTAVDRIFNTLPFHANKRPWRFMGYSGYTIIENEGHLSWGLKPNGGIFQAGGMVAHRLALEHKKWMPPEFKITRLDLAITMAFNEPHEMVRELGAVQRQDWRLILPHPDKGGGTLYVGARTSDAFGRLYDKGALLNRDLDQGAQLAPAVLWRAEVEYKRLRAKLAYEAFQSWPDANLRRSFIVSEVSAWFQNRGIPLGISPYSPSIVSVAHRAQDDVRTIKWLYAQVRPVLIRLKENGKAVEAAHALGLNEGALEMSYHRLMGDEVYQWSFFDKFDGWD